MWAQRWTSVLFVHKKGINGASEPLFRDESLQVEVDYVHYASTLFLLLFEQQELP